MITDIINQSIAGVIPAEWELLLIAVWEKGMFQKKETIVD